jgi:hypothetical protein
MDIPRVDRDGAKTKAAVTIPVDGGADKIEGVTPVD